MEGVSISEYVIREVGKALGRPTRAEVLRRLRVQPVRTLTRGAASMVRAERDRR